GHMLRYLKYMEPGIARPETDPDYMANQVPMGCGIPATALDDLFTTMHVTGSERFFQSPDVILQGQTNAGNVPGPDIDGQVDTELQGSATSSKRFRRLAQKINGRLRRQGRDNLVKSSAEFVDITRG